MQKIVNAPLFIFSMIDFSIQSMPILETFIAYFFIF